MRALSFSNPIGFMRWDSYLGSIKLSVFLLFNSENSLGFVCVVRVVETFVNGRYIMSLRHWSLEFLGTSMGGLLVTVWVADFGRGIPG